MDEKRVRQASRAVLRGDKLQVARAYCWQPYRTTQPCLVDVPLSAKEGFKDHDEGKQAVAGNRCGNECGRRSVKGDYLCARCRMES